MGNKLIVFTLALLFLVIFSQMQKPIAYVLDLDPPSVYNFGSGGITAFYNSEKLRRAVQIIDSLNELRYIDPKSYALLILGPDKDVDDINSIFSWVNDGGVAIVGDELNHSRKILDYIGVEQTAYIPGVGEADCLIENKTLRIVIDVARALYSSSSKAAILCLYDSLPIAYNISYGNGWVIVIGDSSIVINEVLAKPYISANNTQFMDYIIGGRGLVIYEGGRIYRPVEAQAIAQAISITINGLSNLLQWLLFRQGIISLLEFFAGLVALSMLYLVIKFGISPNPREYLSSSMLTNIEYIEKIRRDILIGASKWWSNQKK